MNGRGKFLVRRVMSTSAPRRRQPASAGVIVNEVMPLHGVLAIKSHMFERCGRPVVNGVRVGESSYRYTWERFTEEGARFTDTLWITVKSWR